MNKAILIILAILLPPIAVFLNNGAGKDLLINIVLCLFFLCTRYPACPVVDYQVGR